jgi:hypothetical protein
VNTVYIIPIGLLLASVLVAVIQTIGETETDKTEVL